MSTMTVDDLRADFEAKSQELLNHFFPPSYFRNLENTHPGFVSLYSDPDVSPSQPARGGKPNEIKTLQRETGTTVCE